MMIQAPMIQALTSSLYQQSTKMTDEQTDKLAEFLSNYDTENLSDDDAQAIVREVKGLGITAGADLASALGDAGISAQDLAEQAGVAGADRPKRPPPPPPPPTETQGISTVDDAIVQLIADAVEAYDETEEETTLGAVVTSALEEAGYDSSQPLINFYS